MKEVDKMEDQMDSVSRVIEKYRKESKGNQKHSNMNDEWLCGAYQTHPRIESVNVKIGQEKLPTLKCTEKMRVETNKKNITEYSGNVELYQKLYNIYEWNTKRRRKKELSRRNIWGNNFWKLSKLHDKHQTTYSSSLEKHRIHFKKPCTHKHNPTLRQKSKNKEQILKADRGE